MADESPFDRGSLSSDTSGNPRVAVQGSIPIHFEIYDDEVQTSTLCLSDPSPQYLFRWSCQYKLSASNVQFRIA